MAAVELEFCQGSEDESDPRDKPVLIVGQRGNLQKLTWKQVRGKLQPRVNEEILYILPCSTDMENCPEHPETKPNGYLPSVAEFSYCGCPPSKVSRHNTPSSAHFITRLVRNCLPGRANQCIMVVCERSAVFASACAIARAFPLFSRRSGLSKHSERQTVAVEFILLEPSNGPLTTATLKCLSNAAESIRMAARIVDTPCSEMNTDDFLQEIKTVGSELGVVPTIIRGEELQKKGFGGIYGVGKAAVNPPALAVLSHKPEGATQTIAWVGKGIVYDTGGLSIKGKTLMPGMKRDCGGAAAVLGAFRAAVKQGFKENLHAIFCLAENAIGPNATRPDDIHRLYSGKTVEINNTDAEGRLVLADGAVYASKDLKADIILDIATLTGAQGIATGKYHAGLLTNSENWEKACVKAGRKSGDLVQPLVYTPELHFSEFSSAMADMKNFVSDRNNAQCSCAGLFVAAHLGFDWSGVWIHMDMAFPAYSLPRRVQETLLEIKREKLQLERDRLKLERERLELDKNRFRAQQEWMHQQNS